MARLGHEIDIDAAGDDDRFHTDILDKIQCCDGIHFHAQTWSPKNRDR